jgi:hypothetical protein
MERAEERGWGVNSTREEVSLNPKSVHENKHTK